MSELNEEQPKIAADKKKISYENAVHPSHIKRAQKEQPLIDLKTDIAQKSMNFVERFFSDSANSSENEQSSSTKREVKNDYVPDDPSSLSQELPIPANLNEPLPSLPSVQNQLDTDESRKEFDEHLSTIVSMFPNIEPGVCFMILQASEGKLPETIER